MEQKDYHLLEYDDFGKAKIVTSIQDARKELVMILLYAIRDEFYKL